MNFVLFLRSHCSLSTSNFLCQNQNAMKAYLIRTGSVPVLPGSTKISLSRQASFAGDKNHVQSPKLSLHSHSDHCRDSPANGINRALSEVVAIRSAGEDFGIHRNLTGTATRYFPAILPDEDELRKPIYIGVWQERGISMEELGFGGGLGGGGDRGITTVTGGNGGERIQIGAYYEEMLKSNPTDALLLRNYGKFLHEVEKDLVKAEEYYGRAILANPGDGELLSLYGKLIWETERDEERAKSYFDQAIHADPDDCTVLGSYAQFMWEAEEEEVNGGEMGGNAEESAAELIAAF
ncbi:putative tetratricopeptide-like helical domain-containing protein [Lupinus albus]|uniref:Putative tetratricopeptide-like helical domain-containing protein n=1 Tax=Lupinus albus TaxID=3870 RepID=A0A6A4QII0_LUPAL|nr:putative tetratricopeptide-like helical domain-containing protein [Lupinus albus]